MPVLNCLIESVLMVVVDNFKQAQYMYHLSLFIASQGDSSMLCTMSDFRLLSHNLKIHSDEILPQVFAVFVFYSKTSVIMASGRELCYVLLFGNISLVHVLLVALLWSTSLRSLVLALLWFIILWKQIILATFQTRPDQTKPKQTRPDQTTPDHTSKRPTLVGLPYSP